MNFFKSRSFLLSSTLLFVCLLVTGTFAIYKQHEFENASNVLDSSHRVIYETQDISNKITLLISIQRGYLLTRDESFTKQYIDQQNQISQAFEQLTKMANTNSVFAKDILKLHTYYLSLVEVLDELATDPNADITKTEEIEEIKSNIREVRNSFLDEKYSTLDERVRTIGNIQENLIFGLLLGIFLTGIVLTFLNYFLFRLRRQNKVIGKDLFNSEERLQYAMLASGEGVFDWEISTGFFYFSRFFVEMLDYDVSECVPHIDTFITFLHPEDRSNVMSAIDRFIHDDLKDFSLEFRMKKNDGKFIWVNSRALAIRDEEGKAIRIIGTHRNITHHKMLEANLEKEAIQAEQVAAAKGEFLAHMSHEIRTPLTTITGIAEILQKKQSELNDRQRELVNTLSNSAKSLKELVNDILDFSKIEKGEIELSNEPFLLGNLITEIVSIMAVPANEKGLSFKVSYDDIKYYEYRGDEGRIKQILINLIGNAIKFTDEGTINVLASVEEDLGNKYLSFAVQDTGIGIDVNMMDHIFLEFKQGDSSISRKYGGTGLGLPISKKLSALMGGELRVESRKGFGSTFVLYLPIQDRGLKLIDDADLELNNNLKDKLSSIIQKQQKALIVEDYEGNIVILSYMMEEIGLNYDVARTGLEALNMWKSNHYDIILMDVQMPEMDGLTATREIRLAESESHLAPTPVVGMTAHALIQDKDKCIDAGMTDYISKPINNELLKEKIYKHINIENIKSKSSKKKKTGTE